MAIHLYKNEPAITRRKSPPAVFISSTGRISINGTLVSEFGASWTHCQLLYDDEKEAIMIKLVRPDAEFALPLCRREYYANKRGTAACPYFLEIQRKGFFAKFRIDLPERSLRIPAHYDRNTRTIVVRLDTADANHWQRAA